MIQIPRLLDTGLMEVARLHPVSLELDLQMHKLSTATLILAEGQTVVAGQYIELYTGKGSAGVFRVQQVEQEAGSAQRVALEHGIISMADSIIPQTIKEQRTPAADALELIMSSQSMWVLGSHDFTDADLVTWSCDYSNVYESLVNVMTEFPDRMMTFDQSQTPWVLTIAKVSDESASECRLTRNMTSLSIETDRTELCTKLYIPQGNDDPVVLDADTQSLWGIVSRKFEGDSNLTLEEQMPVAQRYLEEHKNPKIVVSIDAIDLSAATGESMDAFHLGRMCRVCLPDYGQTVSQRIIALSYPDVYGDPDHVNVTLADSADTASADIAGLVVDTTVIRRYVDKGPKGEWTSGYFLVGQPVVSTVRATATIAGVSIDYVDAVNVTIQGKTLEYIGKPRETEEEETE